MGEMKQRGFFGIGIAHGKTESNFGTLWRTAYQLGASYIFSIGRRYPKRQSSDTVKAWRHLPVWEFTQETFTVPYSCVLVGIETSGKALGKFRHPERACYVLGAEDSGLPGWVLDQCVSTVSIESLRTESFNVAVAGSIIMYDRLRQQ